MNRHPLKVRASIAHHIVKQNSIRGTAELMGCDINTVMWLVRDLGRACEEYQDRVFVGLKGRNLQLDEIWSYIRCKEDKVPRAHKGELGWGSHYTWVALDWDSRLVPCWHIGKRSQADANIFAHKLAQRYPERIQISTDAFKAYLPAIEDAFGADVDYAHLIKVLDEAFDKMSVAQWRNEYRHHQPELTATQRIPKLGSPDPERICTSHIERFNRTIRMNLRRFARATDAYSKSFENHKASYALMQMHYNFARIHHSLRCTPAMAAGIADHIWTMEEIAALEPAPAANRPKTYRKKGA